VRAQIQVLEKEIDRADRTEIEMDRAVELAVHLVEVPVDLLHRLLEAIERRIPLRFGVDPALQAKGDEGVLVSILRPPPLGRLGDPARDRSLVHGAMPRHEGSAGSLGRAPRKRFGRMLDPWTFCGCGGRTQRSLAMGGLKITESNRAVPREAR